MRSYYKKINNCHDYIAITTCTGRKRSIICKELHASSLNRGPQISVLNQWYQRIKASEYKMKASKVYCGRSFKEALSAGKGSRHPLFIISAGLGLVNENTLIPGYNLTVAGSGHDNVKYRISGEKFNLSKWWLELNKRFCQPAPITALLKRNKDTLVVLALSQSYTQMIQAELSALSPSELARVRLIGLSLHAVLEKKLQPFIMPYDARLDGPDSGNRGTKCDFAQRAMRHFATEIIPDGSDDLENQKKRIFKSMQKLRYPVTPIRKRAGDNDIVTLITDYLGRGNQSASDLLRTIRNEEKIACEQKRFKKLYHIAKESAV